jgi:hypothetical protein
MIDQTWVSIFAIGGTALVAVAARSRAPWLLILALGSSVGLALVSPFEFGRTVVILLVPAVGTLAAVGSRDPRMSAEGVAGASFGAAMQFAIVCTWSSAVFFLSLPILAISLKVARGVPARFAPWLAVPPTILVAVALLLGIGR